MQRGQTERERSIKFYNTGSDLPADVTMYYFSKSYGFDWYEPSY